MAFIAAIPEIAEAVGGAEAAGGAAEGASGGGGMLSKLQFGSRAARLGQAAAPSGPSAGGGGHQSPDSSRPPGVVL